MKCYKITYSLLIIFAVSSTISFARQRKENDNDIIYDESKVPHYDLPELLLTAEGDSITNADDWMNIRRPQVLSLFSNLVYGRIPNPTSPILVDYILEHQDSNPKPVARKRKKKSEPISMAF